MSGGTSKHVNQSPLSYSSLDVCHPVLLLFRGTLLKPRISWFTWRRILHTCRTKKESALPVSSLQKKSKNTFFIVPASSLHLMVSTKSTTFMPRFWGFSEY